MMLNKQLKFLKILVALFATANDLLIAIPPARLEETPMDFYEKYFAPQTVHVGGRGGVRTNAHPLPQKYYLKDINERPSKNQEPLGTCVSFAVGACVEHYHRRSVSEAEFTVLAETQLPEGDCRPGLFLGNALRLAQQNGFIDEARMPYADYLRAVAHFNGVIMVSDLKDWEQDDIELCLRHDNQANIQSYNLSMQTLGFSIELSGDQNRDVTPYRLTQLDVLHHVSRNALAQALQYRSRQYQERGIGEAANADIESIKRALCSGHPVAAAVNVFDGCWEANAADPRIKMPLYSVNHDESHAVVLTGYNDREQSFLLKNSWGQNWGKDGLAWIPYAYIRKYATELVAV